MRIYRSIMKFSLVIMILTCGLFGALIPLYLLLFGFSLKDTMQLVVFASGGFVMGTVLGLLVFWFNQITIRRISRLVIQELENISGVDMSLIEDTDKKNILNRIAVWFHYFKQQLDQRIEASQKQANEICKNRLELNRQLAHFRETLQEVFTSFKNRKDLNNTQAQVFDHTSTQIQEYTQSITKISDYSVHLETTFQDLTQYIQQQSHLSQGILSNLDNLKSSLGTFNKNNGNSNTENFTNTAIRFATETNCYITEHTQQFAQIEKILKEIEDIAESTHLLSINASIEASRAGEAGRGFTIVALQIRNLATSSGALTSEIRNQIDTIIDKTRNAHTQLNELHKILDMNMEKVFADMQGLDNLIMGVLQGIERIGQIQNQLNNQIVDMNHGWTESKFIQEALGPSVKELGSCTTELKRNLNSVESDFNNIIGTIDHLCSQGDIIEQRTKHWVKNIKQLQTDHAIEEIDEDKALEQEPWRVSMT